MRTFIYERLILKLYGNCAKFRVSGNSVRESKLFIIQNLLKLSFAALPYILIASLLSVGFAAMADLQPVLAGETVGFSVGAVKSSKQVNKNVSYFDLMLKPGEEHTLEIDIYNNDESPLLASISACTAGTSPSGVIEYDNENVTDDSLKVSFADIATVLEPQVSVPSSGKSRVKINIKMPDIQFDGIMLGGIVIKKSEPPEALQDASGASIQNEYCYVLAVKIGVSETLMEPAFRLRSVGPALSNYHTGIAVNLQNYHAALAKDINIDAYVYYNNEPEPLCSASSSDFNVAPNSNFDYFISCDGKLSAGEYRLLLSAEWEGNIWEFDEVFSITQPDAQDINEQAVNVPGVNYYFVATLCLSLLLIILAAILIWIMISNRRKNKKGENN